MTYAPAHNFQARDVKYTHTHRGLTPPLSCGGGEKALVLTSVVSQCVT